MDIDIDFQTSFDPASVFPTIVPASMIKQGEFTKHPCGIYMQNMGADEDTGLAAIPYDEAYDKGFFKVDCLHLSLLNDFKTKTEIRELLRKDPDWSLLQDEETVAKLFQVHKQAKLLNRVKPQSVQSLADCLALMRPGRAHLIDKYIEDPDGVRDLLYERDDSTGYYFKRSHAISYALTIVLQLHHIKRDEYQSKTNTNTTNGAGLNSFPA